MIPSKTQNLLQHQLWQSRRFTPESYYPVKGHILNELLVLAMRLNSIHQFDFDERRDWANHLHAVLSQLEEDVS